jgi:hypothetical protein
MVHLSHTLDLIILIINSTRLTNYENSLLLIPYLRTDSRLNETVNFILKSSWAINSINVELKAEVSETNCLHHEGRCEH